MQYWLVSLGSLGTVISSAPTANARRMITSCVLAGFIALQVCGCVPA